MRLRRLNPEIRFPGSEILDRGAQLLVRSIASLAIASVAIVPVAVSTGHVSLFVYVAAGLVFTAAAWIAILGRVLRGMYEDRVVAGLVALAGAAFAAAMVPIADLAAPGVTFVGVVAAIGGLGALGFSRRRPSDRMKAAAAQAQLSIQPATFRSPPLAEGAFGESSVRIVEEDAGTAIVVTGGIAPELLIEARGLFSAFAGVKTGDPAFDLEVRTSGPPDLVLARLDADARTHAREVVARQGRVAHRGVRWVSPTVNGELPVVPMLRLAHALRNERTLQEAALGDPDPGVRTRALETSRDPDVLERALADESHHVRTRAAQLLLENAAAPAALHARAREVLRTVEETPGRVSLAAPDGGEVSLARHVGAVSIAKK